MERVWEYTRTQGWNKVSSPIPDWPSSTPLDEPLGYRLIPLGNGDLVVYQSETPEAMYRYLALVKTVDGSTLSAVLVRDLPDLLGLVQEIYPLSYLQHATSYAQRLEDMVRKLFRVLHGHDATQACQECDPEAFGPAGASHWGNLKG
jgi:hypothetical protein